MNKTQKRCTGKRILAFFLALMMGISLIGVNGTTVFAEDLEQQDVVVIENETPVEEEEFTPEEEPEEPQVEDVEPEEQIAVTNLEGEDQVETQSNNVITKDDMVITADGTYQLEEGLSGEIVIETGVTEVTIIGNGAEWSKDTSSYGAVTSPAHTGLKFDCTQATGLTLTLKDIYISNKSLGDNTIDFSGTGNTLIFDGTVVIDHDNNAQGYAGIHVKKGDSLTIYGASGSSFYMYKNEQAAGIGADNGEACGNINFGIKNGTNDFYFYMKGTKQGAVIGNGANCPATPGDITFYSGVYNLVANARGALIGGSAGTSSFNAGNVYIKGGLLNLNVDFSGAAIGGGGFATGNDKEGGNVYLEAGSVRTYIDSNAVSGWSSYGVTEAGVNDVAITANKLNAAYEAVYMLAVDTSDIAADTYTIAVDGVDIYTGSRYAYCYAYENKDRDETSAVYPNGTPGNWIALDEANFYVYATAKDHEVTVNGTTYNYDWNDETKSFTRHECKYVAGKCECGDILEAYKWYYANETDTYTVSTVAEFSAFADIVNAGVDPFAQKTVTLANDIDLATIENWTAIGGAAEKKYLTLTSNDELTAAINEHFIIYDSEGKSYAKGSFSNEPWKENIEYYYLEGAAFAGTFDGNGNQITNMNINTDQGYCGLFGNVTGTIKDFTVAGTIVTTTTGDYVGGACAKLSDNGIVSGVTANVNITATKAYNVGGVVGFVGNLGESATNRALVEKSTNYGEVKGLARVGGIAGRNAGDIKECANYGIIFNASGSKKGTGGIVGMNGSNKDTKECGTIENCYNAGYVNANGGYWTGGIAGFQNGASTTTNCYNSSELGISGLSWSNAGIGQNEGTAVKVYGVDTVIGSEKSSPVGDRDGGKSENCSYVSAEVMTSKDFVKTLNEYEAAPNVWGMDYNNANNGYPIFAWQHECVYTAGKCPCGDVLETYKWYYENKTGSYTVSTTEELAAFADIVNAGVDTFAQKTVTLANDIDLATIENWTAIGGATEKKVLTLASNDELIAALEEHFIIYDSAGNSYVRNSEKNTKWIESLEYYYLEGAVFAGTFDGNGKQITNMNINTDQGYCGLFGNVTGTIKDFTITGTIVTTTTGDYVGGACAKLSDCGIVSGVTATVNITATEAFNIGGIVGFVGNPGEMSTDERALVEMCVNYGEVNGKVRVGGIAGRNAGDIKECANFGKVINASKAKKGTGGIVGMNGVNNAAADYGTVENCYNAGYVDGQTGLWTGGIVGFQNAASTTKNCYNSAELGIYNTVTGKAYAWSNAGIGCNEGTAENVYGIDTVVGSDKAQTVGNQGGESTNCEYKSAEEMKTMAFVKLLGDAFVKDSESINNGYPVLKWQSNGVMGDMNGDGEVDILDMVLLERYVTKDITESEFDITLADLNGDGEVDILDMVLLERYVAKDSTQF